MTRIFLDTEVLVSASFWKGSPYRLINKIIDGEFVGFTTNQVMQEFRKVVKRDFDLSEQETDYRIENFLAILEVVTPSEVVDVVKADLDDNKILEGALAADAVYYFF